MASARRGLGTATSWAVIAVSLIALQWLSSGVWDRHLDWRRWPGVDTFFAGWVQFDGPEYLRIASDGYWYQPGARAPVTWFPLYPIAIEIGSRLLGGPVVAGVVVSAGAGLAGALLFRRWIDDQHVGGKYVPWAIALFLLYPYGWFRYGVVYSDALFLALALGAFMLHERDRWVASAIVAALATATRPTALALIPGLLVLSAERRGFLVQHARDSTRSISRFVPRFTFDRSRWSPSLLWPCAGVSGVLGYSLFLQIRFGAPWAWATAQAEWSGSGPMTWFKAGFVVRMLDWSDPVYSATVLAQATVLILVVITAPAVNGQVEVPGGGHEKSPPLCV